MRINGSKMMMGHFLFAVRGIPTQISFDKDGEEVFPHPRFLSEEEIVCRLREMGMK